MAFPMDATDSATCTSGPATGYARPRLRETSGDFKMPARRQPLLSDEAVGFTGVVRRG
jgi:hypothetical protein